MKRSKRIEYPLHNAAEEGNLDYIERYVEYGNSVNFQTDSNGQTALHCAVCNTKDLDTRFAMCKVLLGNSINACNKEGKTPLHCLLDSSTDDVKLVKLLLSRGANIHIEDNMSRTPLFYAVKNNLCKSALELLQGGAKADVKYHDHTLLSYAVDDYENENMVRLLLAYGANVQDNFSITCAVLENKPKILRILLDSGASLKKIVFDWQCTLMYVDSIAMLNHAIHSRYVDVVDCLLENEIDAVYEESLEDGWDDLIHNRVSLVSMFSQQEANALAQSIAKHCAIQEVKRGQLPPKFMCDSMRIHPDLRKYYDSSVRQLNTMKDTKIADNTDIRYFDLLTKKGLNLARCCTEGIISAFSNNQSITMFPHYRQMLERNVRQGEFERMVRDDLAQVLYEVFQEKLSIDDIYCICDFLSTRDLCKYINLMIVEESMGYYGGEDESVSSSL